MQDTKVSIASGSQIAADGGVAVTAKGGNGVDAAIASALVSLCTDPGVIAPGAGGFITIYPPGGEPIVIDGYAEMPGKGLNAFQFGQGTQEVFLEYGGGMRTVIGYGSIATPGILAALAIAHQKYGILPWSEVLQPSIDWATRGFPLSAVGANYLAITHKVIFGWHQDSYQPLHRPDGSCLKKGEIVYVPHLAESLQQIAQEGVESFYQGELGQKITREIQANGGLLTARDLAEYRGIERSPLVINFGEWQIITNPPPAIGGACLGAMLLLAQQQPFTQWDAPSVKRMVDIQQAVLNYRGQHLGQIEELTPKVERLLTLARMGELYPLQQSPSTIHTSAVDSNGLGCSISASAGYGSGVMISGTGLWFNNSLGELELHPEGLKSITPGCRLVSNMAPTIARKDDGTVLAIGSPGASRITSAIAFALINFIQLKMPLAEAIAAPRLHVEVFEDNLAVAFEPGLNIEDVSGVTLRPFTERSMYFGGVQAALWSPDTGLLHAADPRRVGGVAYGRF
ncbi:gamma-glutamyltransferase [Gloeocapsa sp. PCC 73106]|uniref:gamma-glutamyltransferase n=1 Tax=Gloeocapsa sp. PCC 73106 TaxID=102232 RepID=UPI0002AB9A76|nr:gamma-glutamyltransferase [Gloeocapsa sp. PCC 73106]ELR97771.1 gamma-glutamyltransferase [Gloeocapsa sp. PCC 73106]